MKTRLNEMAIQRKFIDNLGLSKDEAKKLLTKIMRNDTNWSFDKIYVTLNLILTNNPEFVEEINVAEDYTIFRCCKTENQKLKLLKMFLSYGIDVNKKTTKGVTLLHLAAYIADKEQVGLLLKYGANVNEPNKDKKTPASCLVDDDYMVYFQPERVYDCLTLLIDYGANVDSLLSVFLSKIFFNTDENNKYYKMIFNILEVYDNKFDLSRCSSSIKELYNKLKSI